MTNKSTGPLAAVADGGSDHPRAPAGGIAPPKTVVADACYWNERQIDEVVGDKHILL
jgi:hypothetical protein